MGRWTGIIYWIAVGLLLGSWIGVVPSGPALIAFLVANGIALASWLGSRGGSVTRERRSDPDEDLGFSRADMEAARREIDGDETV
jgi:hypothetical protein